MRPGASGRGSSTSRSTTASPTASSSPRSPTASAAASPSPCEPADADEEEGAMDEGRVTLRGSEPIFPVADVVATVGYYREVLGFREGWTWGKPPDFGGVRRGKVGAMFALCSEPRAPIGGQWHSFFVEGIDALYE